MAFNAVKALSCQNQTTGHPTITLGGILTPATDPADMSTQVFENVLDAIGR